MEIAAGYRYALDEEAFSPELNRAGALRWITERRLGLDEPALVKRGRPPLSDERLVTVAVKMPASMVSAMDERTTNRSDFVRKAVRASLKSER